MDNATLKCSAVDNSTLKGSAVDNSTLKGSAVDNSMLRGSAPDTSALKGSALDASAQDATLEPHTALYPLCGLSCSISGRYVPSHLQHSLSSWWVFVCVCGIFAWSSSSLGRVVLLVRFRKRFRGVPVFCFVLCSLEIRRPLLTVGVSLLFRFLCVFWPSNHCVLLERALLGALAGTFSAPESVVFPTEGGVCTF